MFNNRDRDFTGVVMNFKHDDRIDNDGLNYFHRNNSRNLRRQSLWARSESPCPITNIITFPFYRPPITAITLLASGANGRALNVGEN